MENQPEHKKVTAGARYECSLHNFMAEAKKTVQESQKYCCESWVALGVEGDFYCLKPVWSWQVTTSMAGFRLLSAGAQQSWKRQQSLD
eukprot:1895704-Amphidinium_carterae.2